ncbi:HAD family hydrolase [Thalassorhabdus alkalitolerans]|uniref:HAD family hydrolase n=2 Tax=Thalassorhabdus alkalitolerans TaxID=2282697 RepID=A0ABW0YSH7_9BACI
MTKAMFLDFFGTIVFEDNEMIKKISKKTAERANNPCTWQEVNEYWWNRFSEMFEESYGEDFLRQREIEIISLQETLDYFDAELDADKHAQFIFDYWERPEIYKDAELFLKEVKVPVFILSNIDKLDLEKAADYHHLHVEGLITSEDVRAYKPRVEIFKEGLKQAGCRPEDVLHVGDSLKDDVQGAQKAGIKAVWINREKRNKPVHASPEFEVTRLTELFNYI